MRWLSQTRAGGGDRPPEGVTRHFDAEGNEIYPCRCGKTHSGDYGHYEWAHHNCFHREPLRRLPEPADDTLMCPLCGETWTVAGEAGSASVSGGEDT